MLQKEYKSTATFYFSYYFFMNTVLFVVLVIIALVLLIILSLIHYTFRGRELDKQIRKNLEAEFQFKTDQAFDLIKTTRDKADTDIKALLAKIDEKVKQGDEYLEKAKDKLKEAEALSEETKADRTTAMETLEKTEKNYQEYRDYLQTAKDKDKAAQHHLDEAKTLHLEAENATKKLLHAEGNIFDSMCQFIRNQYSSSQTQTKLKTFAKHFVEHLESLQSKD